MEAKDKFRLVNILYWLLFIAAFAVGLLEYVKVISFKTGMWSLLGLFLIWIFLVIKHKTIHRDLDLKISENSRKVVWERIGTIKE